MKLLLSGTEGVSPPPDVFLEWVRVLYRREVDGLRAVAILPVIFYHAGYRPFSGGYVGVDVFFVISGYLITAILLADIERGTFSLLQFYERRARRILPALFFILLITIPLSLWLMMPAALMDFAQSLLSVSVFLSNVFFYTEASDYFRHDAEFIPLLHTWSLAVEEQFYILFPLVLAILWGFGRRPVLAVLIAGAFASFAFAQWAAYNWPLGNFYLTPSRAWELLAGSFCAFALHKRERPWHSELGALAGIGLIVASVVVFDRTTPTPSLYTVAPVLGAVLVILCATPETIAGRVLSQQGLVLIGLISYSAYLWHQPVLAFGRLYTVGAVGPAKTLAMIVASLGLAYLTWRYVEIPFRHRRDAPAIALSKRPGLFAASLAGLVAFGTIGFYGHNRDGMPNRFSPPEFVNAGQFALPMYGNGYCFYALDRQPNLETGTSGLECTLGATEVKEQRVLLFGDSYAGQWEPFWDELGKSGDFSVHAITASWCGPSFNPEAFPHEIKGSKPHAQCRANRAFVKESIGEYDLVVLAGQWDEIMEKYHYLDDVFDIVDAALAWPQTEVVLMPVPVRLSRQSVERAVYFSNGQMVTTRSRFEAILNDIHADFARYSDGSSRVHFLSREDVFGVDPRLTTDGLPYSLDGGHISIYGSLAAAEVYLQRNGERTIDAH